MLCGLPENEENMKIRIWDFFICCESRGGGRTGAAGAFAPVNFWQRVHCTRPEGHLQSEGQKNPRKLGCAYLRVLLVKIGRNAE